MEEMIVIAALEYNIDISEAGNVRAEFQRLRQSEYSPVDTVLANRFTLDGPQLNSPSLELCFNPCLPRELYSSRALAKLARAEGFRASDYQESDIYELLQLSCLTEQFYHGKVSNIPIDNTETDVEYEPVSDLQYHLSVLFGIRGSVMHLYSYSELLTLFESRNSFIKPNQAGNLTGNQAGDTFTDRQISKLLILSEHSLYSGETDATFQIRHNLSLIIRRIQLLSQETNSKCLEFLNVYINSDPLRKRHISEAITKLQDLAMYMRGWSGTGELPIAVAIVPSYEQVNVEIRVNGAIGNFELACSFLGPIGEQILDLPMYKYHRGGQFIPCNSVEEGLTIGQRINIVKDGESSSSIHSCIRLTSNLLASTCVFYEELLGLSHRYRIENLAMIS